MDAPARWLRSVKDFFLLPTDLELTGLALQIHKSHNVSLWAAGIDEDWALEFLQYLRWRVRDGALKRDIEHQIREFLDPVERLAFKAWASKVMEAERGLSFADSGDVGDLTVAVQGALSSE